MTRRFRKTWALTVLGALALAAQGQAQLRPTTKRVFAWVESLAGSEDQPLQWPTGVAAGSAEEFAVLDAGGPRLVVFRRTGVAWQIAHVADLPATASSIAFEGGRYLVSCRSPAALKAFDSKTFTERNLEVPGGVVPGPMAAAPGGGLLLADLARNRVFLLDGGGGTLKQTTLGVRVSALVARRSGGFLASVAEKGQILSFDANWQADGEWGLPDALPLSAWPSGLVANPGGEFLVIDRHAGRILVLNNTGQLIGIGSGLGFDSGLLYLPAGATRLVDGLLVVADEGNGRVQLFRRVDRSYSP